MDRRVPSEALNERLAHNLRALRERAGMSQRDLAEAMTERGRPWHQSTVYRVESGKQELSFAEVYALAAILDTSTDRFTWSSPEATATEMVYAAGARLRQRYEQVAEAVHRLLAGQETAWRILAEHEGSGWPRADEAIEDVRARTRDYSLDYAIAEGVRRHEEPDGEGEPDRRGGEEGP